MRHTLAVTLVMSGCALFDPDQDTADTGPEPSDTHVSACPGDLDAATSSGMSLFSLTVQNVAVAGSFRPTATYEGRPSACIDDTGHTVDYLFEVGGELYGQVQMDVQTAGSQSLTDGPGSVSITLLTQDPPLVFGPDTWQSGTWYVDTVGPTFDADLQGTAVRDGNQLSVQLSIEGNP